MATVGPVREKERDIEIEVSALFVLLRLLGLLWLQYNVPDWIGQVNNLLLCLGMNVLHSFLADQHDKEGLLPTTERLRSPAKLYSFLYATD